MSKFETITLQEAKDIIIDYRGKTPKKSEEGIRLITAKVVKKGVIIDERAEYVAMDYFDTWMTRGMPQENDIVMTTEAPLGEVAILGLKKYALGQRIITIRVNPLKMNAQYMYFAMQSEYVQSQLLKRATGTTVIGIKQTELLEVPIPYYHLEIQMKIANILNAYTTLIENNNRRISILEEMAQKLYREWFIHFRFPGHENTKMVESEMGLIPEGWEAMPFSQVVYVNPRYKKPSAEFYSFVEMAGLETNHMIVSVKEERTSFSGAKFANGDTLVARITPCLENGKTGFVQCLKDNEIGTGSTEFIVLKSKRLLPEMVYLSARQDEFRELLIKSMSGASGRQRANAAVLDEFLICVPSQQILSLFAAFVQPAFKEVEQLHRKNVNLRKTRDLLLPRLISGDIDVSELDIPIKEE